MKKIFPLLLLLALCSCAEKKMTCDFTSHDEELLIYNNILSEFIERHTHYRYLGGRESALNRYYDQYYSGYPLDTVAIDSIVTKEHNLIFNDSAAFCVFYLDTVSTTQFVYEENPEGKFNIDFTRFVNGYTNNTKAAYDSLNSLQNRYASDQFGLCTARIEKMPTEQEDVTCNLGRLRLSKLVLNRNRSKGLLFYDWHCTTRLCGHRGIIEFYKGKKRWHIKDLRYRSVY